MLLRHADVRAAARDVATYSSDAPFRVPIPSEETMRTVRQLPIETDPPLHTDYRAIVEPFFARAKKPEVVAKVESLIGEVLTAALAAGEVEVVREMALPVQSRALTYLLDVPESEAAVWTGWGVHVFYDEGSRGNVLEDYLNAKFDAAEAAGATGDDFFSALARAEFRGRPLTREEAVGFANLAFAGGRDTVIYSIACAVAYLAAHPEALDFLRGDPKRAVLASEELFRAFMPLTHIGRVCPAHTEVKGVPVPPGGRVSLCWASANFDEDAFEDPGEVRLDRKPNPHLSFGFGAHLCLGAPHARLILRTLLKALAERVRSVEVVEAEERTEAEQAYSRTLGYHSLRCRFRPGGQRSGIE